ncbi:MAG: hypothetical protein ABI718_00535 [Acidobacteriota bacterium]
MRRILTTLLSATVVAVAFTAQAQTVPFDLEIGYRWLDLKGSEDMYRTQINERDGLLIRNFTLATSDFSGRTTFMDRFRVDVSDLGAGPAGSLRIEAEKSRRYHLRVGYRSTNAFSALPGFANPLLGEGIVPGQHTYERTRRMLDVDLELLPDRAIVPFVGYTWNDNHGPGTTTYNLGQDEFRLSNNLKERDRELRAGASFHFGSVQGQLTQGWRSFRGTDSLSLASGAGAGNNPGSILDQPVSAQTISRTDRTDVDTPFTNFYITGQPLTRIRLIGNYVRFAADSDGSESENAAGTFISFPISRFFTGISEQGSSSAKNTTWRGGGRAEITVYPNVDVSAGFQKEHRELDGSALITTIFLQSITFGGVDRRDLETILKASSSLDRNEDVLNASVSARALGPFALRGEYRESKQDVKVSPDLSEIVVPGAQEGQFDRRVHTFDVSGTFRQSGLMLGAAWRTDNADNPVFRTDFLDRDRVRVRGAWSSPKDFFRAGLTAERTNQSNDRPEAGYDARIRQYSGDVEVAPRAWLRLRGSLSQFRADSNISFRHPENFSIDESVHSENGKAREGGVSFLRGPFSLDTSLGRFENSGTTPFDMDRYRLRLTYDFKSKTGVAVEWDRDKYDEPSPSYGKFDASRYGVYLRWHP